MAIEIRDLRVSYGRHRALDGASFDVLEGRVTGFLGHNGAGKTTALRAVIGFTRASGGTIAVDGFDPRRSRREVLARVGSLIEECRFHAGWSGERNLVELARLAGLDRRAAKAAAGARLEQVGLSAAASRAVGGYSQGMRQRLGIAQALLASPRHVLLDEPTNGLDPDGIAEIRTLLADLAHREGRAVLLSSHQLGEVTQLVDRVVVLREGRVVAEGDRRDLLADPKRRYVVSSPEAARLREAVERDGIALRAVPGGDGELELEMGARDPAACLTRWVRAGLSVESFAPRPVTLEEFYLHASHGDLAATPSRTPSPAKAPAPAEELAPTGSFARVLRHDTSRLARHLALFAVPLAFAGLGLWRDLAVRAAERAEIADAARFSATDRTAFVLAFDGLVRALPVLALFACGFASQLLAAEHGRGTLRNLVARPLGRGRIALAKATLSVAAGWFGYLLLCAGSVAAAASVAPFGDLDEILPNGASFPILSAGEAWPTFRSGLLEPILPLAAAGAIGFLCGALVRTAAAALAFALGTWLTLDLARGFLSSSGHDAYLPTAYLPSFLGGRSAVDAAALFLGGATNASFEHGSTALSVPLAWIAGCVALAWLRFRSRSFR